MPQPIKILIVGNGFGGTYALKNLHKFFHKNSKIELSLVGEKNYFLFTPLLHEVATGGINPENIIEPIRKVLGCCLHNFYLGKAEFINTRDRTVKVGNAALPYDYLILAPGAQTNFHNVPGAERYSFPLKSLSDATKIKNHIIAQIEDASHIEKCEERKKKLTFIIVGGGPTGVEFSAELYELIKDTFSHYYPKEEIEDVRIILVQKSKELVPQFGEKIREKSLEILRKKGVEIMLQKKVKEVGASYILLDDNTKIPAETVLWVAGIKPVELEFDKIIEKTPDGKMIVNEYLQVSGHPEIFAIGDAAARKKDDGAYLPALAQIAEKEALAVAKNIQLLINGGEPWPFLYHQKVNLMSVGQWMAVGEIFNFTIWGHITWWIWRTIYLFKLISWKKKIKVALDWTINLFYPRDISQI